MTLYVSSDAINAGAFNGRQNFITAIRNDAFSIAVVCSKSVQTILWRYMHGYVGYSHPLSRCELADDLSAMIQHLPNAVLNAQAFCSQINL
jgi:hypothetical protein